MILRAEHVGTSESAKRRGLVFDLPGKTGRSKAHALQGSGDKREDVGNGASKIHTSAHPTSPPLVKPSLPTADPWIGACFLFLILISWFLVAASWFSVLEGQWGHAYQVYYQA